jgi:hypothetical protein
MAQRKRIRVEQVTQATSAPVSEQSVFAQPRTLHPSSRTAIPSSQKEPPPNLQTQLDQASHFGHHLGQVSVFARTATIQPKSANPASHHSPSTIGSVPSNDGIPLRKNVRRKMESAFQTDFSDVQVHEGPEAKSINAIAYTQGNHIHFQPGQYKPDTQSGQELLGHELTHVVQQRSGRVPEPQNPSLTINANPVLEQEADASGAKAAQGESVDLTGEANGIQRKEVVQRMTEDEQPPAIGYEQPPAIGYEQPPAIGYEQPPAIGYEQPPAIGYEQPPAIGYEQPPAIGYEQPPAIGYEQPPAIGYEQPPAIGYEQPPAIGYEQPPAIGYEQPPAIGYEQPPGETSLPIAPTKPVASWMGGARPSRERATYSPQIGHQREWRSGVNRNMRRSPLRIGRQRLEPLKTTVYEQPPAIGYEQPPAIGYEQPPAIGYEQPPAIGYEQPPAIGYEQPPAIGYEQPLEETSLPIAPTKPVGEQQLERLKTIDLDPKHKDEDKQAGEWRKKWNLAKGRADSPNVTTKYYNAEERAQSQIRIGQEGKLMTASNQPLDTTEKKAHMRLERPDFPEVGYVMSPEGNIHVFDGGYKNSQDGRTSQGVHHSSPVAGGAVAAAGTLSTEGGVIREITDASGHYKPSADYTYQAVKRLHDQKAAMEKTIVDEKTGEEGPSSARVTLVDKRALENESSSTAQADQPLENISLRYQQFLQTGGNEKQIRHKAQLNKEIQVFGKRSGKRPDDSPESDKPEAVGYDEKLDLTKESDDSPESDKPEAVGYDEELDLT